MTIFAKFASTCPRCQRRIEAGTRVTWEPGSKATHPICQAVAPVEPQPVQRIAVEDAGVYVLPDDSIVKVKANQQKTRTYAMRWKVISGVRLSEADTREHGEYEFEPGLVHEVAANGRKMTLEEAKQFILRYGQCCRCGRKLKDATSVERGIGPVCVKYFADGNVTGAALMVGAA